MDFEAFKVNLTEIFAKNSGLPAPNDERAEKLFKLTTIMLEVNKTMNLTAITDMRAVILKHYADSLTVSPFIPEGARVIDIGCGAGFPTLPLAVFRPDIQILAIDGTAKRIDYVKDTANKLGLDNVKAVAARAEELAAGELRESFDVSTARAVAALPVLSELCLPFVKVGGCFAAMKASQADSELALAANAIKLCGGSVSEVRAVDLTSGGDDVERRNIVLIKKTSPTPKLYPRHYSKISKKPL